MKKIKPIVSVILPVHNSERFLPDCLKSLKRQAYRRIEIIAIDDRSSDNSFKILREFAKKDKRIRIYRNVKRYGIAITLNRLILKAKGQFIAFMDANDISSSQRIKKQLKFLKANPDIVAVGTQCRFVNERNKRLGKSNFPKENHFIYESPLHGISMQFETVLVNKMLLPKDVLRFTTSNSSFIYSDVLIKLLPYGKFANLTEYLHYHRENPKIYFWDLRKNIISFVKLWLISKTNYDYNPRLSSIFTPFIRTQTAK
ncbi:glycosyltransferase family 2 protein [Candidatus Roizmanbacteria bacterium]|nr:glycosyltransferase family 2 protein [Candidatus Roizmanbacteria bacterium]